MFEGSELLTACRNVHLGFDEVRRIKVEQQFLVELHYVQTVEEDF